MKNYEKLKQLKPELFKRLTGVKPDLIKSKLISEKVVGNRAGRIEPRFLKKRCNTYRLMTKPRYVVRAEVVKNGHPKM